ncbi:MAG: hypothetical protein JSV84_07155 [Gemmatimonadota bacterium]|nr:MAG: hypothetical protein JSV84_07155 [Gemmatimonadota bacterium]
MSAQRFNVAILLMGLSLIFWINDGIGSQHEDEIQSILYIFPDYLFPDESHIWPLDQPTQEGQTSSQEHDICGVVGEFRTEGGNHFHGGVDMPACNGTDVYSVMKDVFVIESTGSRISIRGWFHVGGPGSGWNRADDGDDDAWYTTRYLHIKNRKVQYKDKIIWNQSLTGRYYSEGWYYYPQHLLIADVDDYEPSGCDGDHLHYGEVSYNDHYDTFIYGYLIVNPLNPPNPSDPNDPRPLLNPFTDDNSDDPEILGKWLYYQENGSSLSRGSGSQSDPYLAEDKFDIKLRARDEIGTRNVAPWALAYNLYDEGGSEVSGGSYYHEYYFDLLGPINTIKGLQ